MVVEPIEDRDIEDVCAFWRKQFASRCRQDVWTRAFRRPWHPQKPNNGFLMRHRGEIVGALGAIYSRQTIQDVPLSLCNMTSWYVQESHRSHSILLLRRLLRQPNFHFTNFSANPTVAQLLPGFGFKPLCARLVALPNFPLPFAPGRAEVLTHIDDILAALPADRAKVALDHADCENVRQIAVGSRADGYCHLLFGRGSCRRLPCAMIYDASRADLFRRFWPRIALHLLRSGAVVTRIEARLLDGMRLPMGFSLAESSQLFFLSSSIDPRAVRTTYSEVVALAGC
jgi:hypothetical protein